MQSSTNMAHRRVFQLVSASRRLHPFSSSALSQHTLNVNLALKKTDEGRSFGDHVSQGQPITVLQGIGPVSKDAMNALGIHTISDLANYRYYHLAKAIATMADVEDSGQRAADSQMNINKGVDKAYETLSFKLMAESPVAALQGISEDKGALFAHVGVVTIGDLANLKYCKWAESMVTLSEYEEAKEGDATV
jgi:hypothetical protein